MQNIGQWSKYLRLHNNNNINNNNNNNKKKNNDINNNNNNNNYIINNNNNNNNYNSNNNNSDSVIVIIIIIIIIIKYENKLYRFLHIHNNHAYKTYVKGIITSWALLSYLIYNKDTRKSKHETVMEIQK